MNSNRYENSSSSEPQDNTRLVNPTTNIGVGVGVYSPFGNLLWWVGATSAQTMHMEPLRALRLGRDNILAYRYWMIYGHIETPPGVELVK